MESRPPQENPPRRPSPSSGRRPNGSNGAPTPTWLWLFLILVVGLIIYIGTPKNETQVSYSPWFLDQVEKDNIESLSIQGNEAHGKLRVKRAYRPATGKEVMVDQFVTYFPSEQSIEPVVKKLETSHTEGVPPARVEASSP